MQLRLFSSLIVGAFALALVSCEPLFERKVSGIVLAVDGSAVVNKSTKLSAGGFVQPGDVIRTAAGSRVSLMLVPEILVEINGAAEMVIDKLHLQRNGDETILPMTARDATIELRRGTLVAVVGQAQTEPSLTVRTPFGEVTSGAVRTFEVAVTADRLSVFCVRNTAIFRANSPGSPVRISAGYFATFPPWNSLPQKAADAGAAAQEKVTALLRTEKHLLRLQDEKASLFRPW